MSQRVVLITGANGGLGTAVTEAFLGTGAAVIGVARRIEASEFTDDRFVAMPADLSRADAVRVLVDQTMVRFGRLDAAVHLMGGFAGGQKVDETGEAGFDRMLEINFKSAVHLFRAVVPVMRRSGGGRLIAIGSRAAVDPPPGLGAYSASKAALVSLMRTLAVENKDHGITSNVILPSTMDTTANRAAMPGADASRWVPPESVAGLILYLASASAAHVTGAVIPIYGKEL
ncbi:MAG: SDR family NAD(P)-dependent oxidoreductase [Bryobacteraceae bacterium]